MLFCIELRMNIFPLHEPYIGTWLWCTYGEQQYLAPSAIVIESFSRPASKKDELLCRSGYPSFDESLHSGRLTSASSPLPQFLVLTLRFKIVWALIICDLVIDEIVGAVSGCVAPSSISYSHTPCLFWDEDRERRGFSLNGFLLPRFGARNWISEDLILQTSG